MEAEFRERCLLVEKETNLLVFGYCRDYFNLQNILIPNDVQYIIFLYFGVNNTIKCTINRYGFFTKQIYTYSGTVEEIV